MKQKYPYTDENGVLHASRHVTVFIDIPYVRSELESSDDWHEEDGSLRRSYVSLTILETGPVRGVDPEAEALLAAENRAALYK